MTGVLLISLATFGLAFAGLAVGVLMGRAPIRGSCGGLSCNACAACPRRPGHGPDETPAT